MVEKLSETEELRVEQSLPHNFCLTKQNILDKSEIQQAFDSVENKLSTLHFTFLLGARSIKEAGLCVILTKKNIKKATKRNLCRRIIKESFRLHKDLLDHKSLIVLSKKTAAQATKEELWQSITRFEYFLKELH
ncbi:ribonuclease P protein component [Francisella opportunistica]|uniref:Ribonuclease P protein component n=1 Tax=Francisella opportunistica TaxID=2016517 RepID=A0A345JP76_9GAMM|nr:ribonuclease P protein component [Francisella opportunistica]AXH30775.1 ribonuclease P protein component [Francisella opportunistica]AXH32420.1 ribonuclease P protein component [Francisella opportunistica]